MKEVLLYFYFIDSGGCNNNLNVKIGFEPQFSDN